MRVSEERNFLGGSVWLWEWASFFILSLSLSLSLHFDEAGNGLKWKCKPIFGSKCKNRWSNEIVFRKIYFSCATKHTVTRKTISWNAFTPKQTQPKSRQIGWIKVYPNLLENPKIIEHICWFWPTHLLRITRNPSGQTIGLGISDVITYRCIYSKIML